MNPLRPILEYLDKARSRVYGIFIFWVIVLHLPVIFTSLFVNQGLIYQKTHLLKNEYIKRTFFNFNQWWEWVIYIILAVSTAMLLTWLMVWILPKTLIKKAYGRELEDQYEREFMKLTKEDELDDRKKKLADKQLVTVAKEETVAQKQEKLESREEEVWLTDYESFKKTNLFNDFYLVPEAIYDHYGRITVTDDYGVNVIFSIPNNLLSYIDGSGLINLDVKDRRIELTDKGRFFLKNYQIDKGAK